MEVLSLSPAAIRRAVSVLRQGGVIAHPADTCFGLAADPMNPRAVARVRAIKGRDGRKPMSLMLPESALKRLNEYGLLDAFAQNVCAKLLPGPVTILLPRGPGVPKTYFPETDRIGLRVPKGGPAQKLLLRFGGPLLATSANQSGAGLCYTHQEVAKAFCHATARPDLILEGALPPGSPASTVLRPENGRLRVLREGPVTTAQLEALGFEVIS